MGAPGVLPSGADLYALTMKGMTQREIAELYGATEHSVWQKLTNYRRGPGRPQLSHAEYIPWKVLKKHDTLYPAKQLRALSRRNQGQELSVTAERELTRWLENLDRNNLVIDYDRDKGWLKVPRIPEDGDGYIRRPAEDDARAT